MIFFDQAVNTVHRSTWILGCLVALASGSPLESLFGPAFCTLFHLVNIFGPIYKVMGGLGLNLFRLAHLKIGIGLVERVNWMLVAILILMVGLALNAGLGLVIYLNPSEAGAAAARMCHGWSGYQGVLHAYQRATCHGGGCGQGGGGGLMRVVLLVLLALHLTEGTVYGVIFHHCFTHDQSMRNILSPHSIKRRMRRQAFFSTLF